MARSMAHPLMSSHQPSFTEWLAAIGDEQKAVAIREEDNMRQQRFETLYQLISFPYDRPEIFPAIDLFKPSAEFQALLARQGDRPCAIRLIPTRSDLPKLRSRGLTLRDCYERWLPKQPINPADYTAEVYRHHENKAWSTTFIVHAGGITGEVIQGLHNQLTQGNTEHPLYQFHYDFTDWRWSEDPGEGAAVAHNIISKLPVANEQVRQSAARQLSAEFYNGYLGGYFEATVLDTGEAFFIDYNRLLGQIAANLNFSSPSLNPELNVIYGAPASPGKAIGRVCVVDAGKDAAVDFRDGDILVCANTDVRYLPYMRRAGAIVTDHGSILSHAAIVARELRKPCIVNTREATRVLRTGETVEVDAGRGAIKKIICPTVSGNKLK